MTVSGTLEVAADMSDSLGVGALTTTGGGTDVSTRLLASLVTWTLTSDIVAVVCIFFLSVLCLSECSRTSDGRASLFSYVWSILDSISGDSSVILSSLGDFNDAR